MAKKHRKQEFEGLHNVVDMSENFIAGRDPSDYGPEEWDDDHESVVVLGRRWVIVGDHYFSYGKPSEEQQKAFIAYRQEE